MRVLVVMISLMSVVISQKNLAANGTASQSSDWFWRNKNKTMTADLAVTGGRTHDLLSLSCSITQADPKLYVAWWMLTFPVDTVYITNVLIYYRGNTLPRFAGYYLYVSNSSISSKTGGSLCYHHEGTVPITAYKDVNCNYLGNQVIFYNKRDVNNIPGGYSDFVIIELCHIEVYGCYKGWWGSACSKPCPATCVEGHCYPGNGNCVWGCNPYNCLNDICDTTTGKCTQGCKIGLSGDYCDKTCDEGKFGNTCAHTCHCINQPCHPKTGECSAGGCKRGYTSLNCSIECSLGYYGYNCNQSCDGCLSDSCDKENGVCTDTAGCKPGWQYGQLKCDKACEDGYFGYGCISQCYCQTDTCETLTGMCPGNRCQLGWMGKSCSQECSRGFYGFNCANICNTCNITLCERYEGNCTHGCIEGYTGYQCLSSVATESDGQTTKENTMNTVYAVIGTFIATTLMCVIIFLTILRFRRENTAGDTKKQNGQNTRGYLNDAVTNDYANIGHSNTEPHYEETIPSSQEQTYDTI